MNAVPTAMTVMDAVWGVWWLSWLAAAFWSDRPVDRPPASNQMWYRVLAIVGMLLLFGIYRPWGDSNVRLWRRDLPLDAAMIAAAVVGFAFTWWARVHIGRLWSSSITRKSNHQIIDTGPYGIVRHPIYSGITLAAFATAVMRGTPLAFAGAAIMTGGWYVKARQEERFLRAQLGADQYAAYARRVPMLVPFVIRHKAGVERQQAGGPRP